MATTRMSGTIAERNSPDFAVWSFFAFLRTNLVAFVLISLLLLAPCFWHSRIQAGDLGSHLYNAWLAQLIERHEIQGVVIAPQWNNVLFDVLVVRLANIAGFVAAERLVVGLAILLFFWGAFAFLSEFSKQPPWLLVPILMCLAYGYTFHMGFMNFYLSVGLALLCLVPALRGGRRNWVLAAALAGLSLLAHPIGFLLGAGLTAYVWLWRRLGGYFRLILPGAVILGFVGLRRYFAAKPEFEASWRAGSLLSDFGHDQFNLFGQRYDTLSRVVLAWAVCCIAGGLYDWCFRQKRPLANLRLSCELYVVALVALYCLPENLRFTIYSGWVGLLVSRLTLVSAILALLSLNCLRLPRWSILGFGACAALFFAFVYHDTGRLDRMESQARALARQLPEGTRVVVVANAPKDWRIEFIQHSIERACIGHCFSYANYEPSSLQFRVRALPGNSVVTDSSDKSEEMSSGDYVVQPEDLPLTSIYQCDDTDFSDLCALPLRAGQKTEDPEAEPEPATVPVPVPRD